MMNFEQVDGRIAGNGFYRHAKVRTEFDEDSGATTKIYDYEHRRRLDLISVYVNERGSVYNVEYTHVNYDRQEGRFSQRVESITTFSELAKALA